MRVSEWSGIPLSPARELVRRDSLQPGDVAVSSHYGERIVKRVDVRGNEGQTTYITWVGPEGSSHVMSEAYPSESTVPLVVKRADIVASAWWD